ncbi:stage II sporulation protein P [Paraliobacillus sediminis]|uniref:stage II sporulation protein P n=1 Tax=Paraliobacillus sediminis TaxID=1885916 RepID=UPI000E3CD894|nr:stage II sporulation protein P [Paraliobacillus sediminis]
MTHIKIKWNNVRNAFVQYIRNGSIWIVILIVLFVSIGLFTTAKPAYRISSTLLTSWTSQINGSSFLYLLGMENQQFIDAYPSDVEPIKWNDFLFELTTNIKPNDVRSLLGRELPGFYAFDRKIIIAGEGTDYTDLPIESSSPLDVVLEERDATMDEEIPKNEQTEEEQNEQTIEGEKVVFVYNTHNRESFLPHLDGVDDPNNAFHDEVNITKVSDRLAESLEAKGIGAQVDHTDFMSVLNKNDWEYWQSYEASKPIVEEALAGNKQIEYVFDLHRDSRRKDDTSTTIDGETYANLFFVIGSDYSGNEDNVALATKLHEQLEATYPGLSRGVTEQGGTGRNGIYNQNLADNAILIEVGGVDNTMEELYRSADALADVFSTYYWDTNADEVSKKTN